MYKLLYFFKYYKIPVTTMNHTDDYLFSWLLEKHQCLSVPVND